MVKCLPEFGYFYCVFEKSNFFFKIRRSKVTDYAALNISLINIWDLALGIYFYVVKLFYMVKNICCLSVPNNLSIQQFSAILKL